MGKDNLKAQAYPLDQGWGLDSGWKSGGSGSFDRDWGPDNGWSRHAESPKTRPGNGGASFAAWEKPADAVPESADWPPPDRLRLPEASPPGFYIVPRSMSGERVLALLFTDKPHSHLVNRIKALNPTFVQGFKAGEMFILGNLLNPTACLREEADLMAAAAKVRAALEPLSEAEADFMARHQAEIALMLGGAGASLGLGTDVLKKGLMQVGETLRDIEYLHQREFVAHGHLQSAQFFTGRQQLYRQLDSQLKATLLGKQLGWATTPPCAATWGYPPAAWFTTGAKAVHPGRYPATPPIWTRLPRRPNT